MALSVGSGEAHLKLDGELRALFVHAGIIVILAKMLWPEDRLGQL